MAMSTLRGFRSRGSGDRPAVISHNEPRGRPSRAVRHDRRYERRALYGMPVMLLSMGALGLAIFSGRLSEWGNSLALVAIWVVAIGGVSSIVVPLNFWYGCPSCRARLPRATPRSDADTSLRFYCEPCNIEWAAGVVTDE